MAPSRLGGALEIGTVDTSKPTLYLIDTFHPEAIEYCQQRFNTILPSDIRPSNWRENAEYLLLKASYLTAEDIAAFPNLKAIGKQGVGIDRIDPKACKERGIKIFNSPGANAQAVAEMAVSLALSIAREVPRIVTEQSQGRIVPKETCSGLLMYRKTVGILGMGNIGQAVARIWRGGFEANIIAYDPYVQEDAWANLPHTRARCLAEVLSASDILTIHMPLTPETRSLISYRELSLMKPTSIVINAARGAIVNELDLERALREGIIWGAGLDCHEEEPPTREKYGKLWEQRVVSTPHIGAATSQTQRDSAIMAAERLYNFAKGKED